MARPYPSNIVHPKGQLDLIEISSGLYHAFFMPPEEALPEFASNPEEFKRLVLHIDLTNRLLTIYPYQVWGMQPMIAKYYKLSKIKIELKWQIHDSLNDVAEIEDFLSTELPAAFVEDYNYGLGFRKSYKQIVSMLEEFDVKELCITVKNPTSIDIVAKKAIIKRSDLEKMCKMVDSITQRAQRISTSLKKDTLSNLFTNLVTKTNPESATKEISAELARQMGKSTRFMPGGATPKEQVEAIEVIRKNGKNIANKHPEALIKLRNDIELVTLEELINRFEEMFNKSMPESQWQKLFDENPFILNMAFGIPVIKVQGQASVGGLKLSGAGNKIADFLVKNSITNNAAIIEIKTPGAKLISPKQYRGGVFAPSTEMTGAINQLLDQIYMFQKEINSLKVASKEYSLESYSVMGILIAGRSLIDTNEKKSFELFRGNSKNIQIVTFDELLMKLKDLHTFLSSTNSPTNSRTANENIKGADDLPF